MAAPIGSKNAVKCRWVIVKAVNKDGKRQYQVSDDIASRRTMSYDFDTFESAQECIRKLKLEKQNG